MKLKFAKLYGINRKGYCKGKNYFDFFASKKIIDIEKKVTNNNLKL